MRNPGFRIPLLVKLPILAFSYLVLRYEYVPRCLPILPICLVTDLQYLFTDAFPRHLCEAVPALVKDMKQCTPGNYGYVIFNSCPRSELGLIEPAVFMLRWKLPILFTAIFGGGDWGPTIQALNTEIIQNAGVTELQVTCAKLGFFDIFINLSTNLWRNLWRLKCLILLHLLGFFDICINLSINLWRNLWRLKCLR